MSPFITKHSLKKIAHVVTAWVVEIAALYMNCPILLTPTVLYVCIHMLQAAINPFI